MMIRNPAKLGAIILLAFGWDVEAMPAWPWPMISAADSTQIPQRKWSIHGYLDAYWSVNRFSLVKQSNPFLVSSTQQNNPSVNLSFVELTYTGKHFRMTLKPATGTYMSANYAAEPEWARNILEANAGFRLSERKEVWLEAGVFSPSYTNESPISRDQAMYFRSMAPELVPYYLNGLRLSFKPSEKISFSGWLVNGWQEIKDSNKSKSVATHLIWQPRADFKLYHNILIGDERKPLAPQLRTRFLNDVYFFWQVKDDLDMTACFDIGHQAVAGQKGFTWWQVNAIIKKELSKRLSIAARAEYFHDPGGAAVTITEEGPRFTVFGGGACLNLKLAKFAMARMEARYLGGPDSIFPDGLSTRKNELLLGTNITCWF